MSASLTISCSVNPVKLIFDSKIVKIRKKNRAAIISHLID